MLALRLALVLLVPSSRGVGSPRSVLKRCRPTWEQSCWPCHGRDAAGRGPGCPASGARSRSESAAPGEAEEQTRHHGRQGLDASYRSELTRREAQRILAYLQDLEDEPAPERPKTAEPRRETTPGASKLPAPPEGAAENPKPAEEAP